MDSQGTIAEHRQRIRVKRGPGKGLLDWIKLCRSFKQQNTAGRIGVVTFEELRKHNKEDDCWTAFRGDVYNITHYLAFHPGGRNELMKAAGTDCTLLFNQVHSHVNLQSMLITFKVGTLATFSPLSAILSPSGPFFLTTGSPKAIKKELKVTADNGNHEDVADGDTVVSTAVNKCLPTTTDTTNEQKLSNHNAIAETRSRRCSREHRDQPSIKYTWRQTETDIILTLTAQYLVFSTEDVTLVVNDHVFEAKINFGNWCYNVNIALENPVNKSTVLLVESELEMILEKVTRGKMWSSLGALLPGNAEMTPRYSDTNDKQYLHCSLEAVDSINYNTKMFTFKLPAASYVIVPTGRHVRVKAKDKQDEWIERSYTPVLPLDGSCQNDRGAEVKLMVKLYNNGAMSSILSSLHIGDTMDISLPVGNFMTSLLDKADDVILIAAGSGFTPMVKVVRKVCMKNCKSEIEKTTVKLLFFNRTVKDILWFDELQSLSDKNPNFTVVHILSRAGSGWTGSRGRLNRHVLQSHMPQASNNQLICVCGPTQFTQLTISTLLDMKFSEDSIHAFE